MHSGRPSGIINPTQRAHSPSPKQNLPNFSKPQNPRADQSMAASSSSHSSSEQIPRPPYTFGVPWPELNEGISYTDAIKSIDSGKTLIEFYSSKYKNSAPLQGWIQRIKNGQIRIDGDVVTDPDTVLRVGCEVDYCRLPWKEPDVPYLLEVLYEDDDMIAINKPSGLQVLPGGLFQQRTVLRQLQWNAWSQNSCCSTKYVVQDPHPAPVHRLGRGTSGILLCAKTKQAKICLAASFGKGALVAGNSRNYKPEDCKAQGISKFYRALVTGLLDKDEIVIRQPIGVMHYLEVATGLYVASPSGKPALSKVQVLERDLEANHTRVEVEIQSGRPHQIRIHLAFIGHPLFGDPLYGVGGLPKLCESVSIDECYAEDGGYQKPARPVPGDCGYYLHAHRLICCHPSSNEMVEITAPLPPILQMRKELAKVTF